MVAVFAIPLLLLLLLQLFFTAFSFVGDYGSDFTEAVFDWLGDKAGPIPTMLYRIMGFKTHKIFIDRRYHSSPTYRSLCELEKYAKEHKLKVFISKKMFYDPISEHYYVYIAFRKSVDENYVRLTYPAIFEI
jgi:hypothetical protein